MELCTPEEWHYTGEGGKHAVFRYVGENPSWKGKILRLTKNVNEATNSTTAIANRHALLFHLLEPHVDMPETIELPRGFVSKLFARTRKSGKIPSRRLKDWNDDTTTTALKKHDSALPGSLLRDYRFSLDNLCCWSIEVKPKAGYTAISPLVTRTRKYQHPRFVLSQPSQQNSSYNPLDLFSSDYNRIVGAFQCLASTPRNNLKVWYGGQQQDPTFDDSWIPMVATILANNKEPFLSQILTLQKLDILDADGAIVLYRHMLERMSLVEEVETLLDAPTTTLQSGQAPHSLLEDSPLAPPPQHAVVVELCDLIVKFQKECLPNSLDNIQHFRDLALSIVERLSVSECCYLLQTWLFSLSLCDISFFVTFWPVDADATPRRQGKDHPGHVMVEETKSVWAYEIKIIDFDPKPAQKLRTRQKKEELLERTIESKQQSADAS